MGGSALPRPYRGNTMALAPRLRPVLAWFEEYKLVRGGFGTGELMPPLDISYGTRVKVCNVYGRVMLPCEGVGLGPTVLDWRGSSSEEISHKCTIPLEFLQCVPRCLVHWDCSFGVYTLFEIVVPIRFKSSCAKPEKYYVLVGTPHAVTRLGMPMSCEFVRESSFHPLSKPV